ncbi:cupredoxin domain-containing protein [Gynuella sunshinyii]|uniref:Plastocyanin n=1 Tax=Gynuella sunshinyii YC6258 TaxID=1445510 RepID=A0A0C5VQ82_9GAMM|nr:cupredoxin domain-containing protein [Gynuella sunshinyii]AJQ92439.1 plastocyanin [Gynuella sunshinyii YC6258]
MRIFLTAILFALSATAMADTLVYNITIKDHVFSPSVITIPVNQRVKFVIENQDVTPEEFEGLDFDVEKIIPGKTKSTVFVGPFAAGTYNFMGEFNADTAKGQIIVE